MAFPREPLIVSIAGRKNSGKTSLLVAVAAELGRRGHRVASVKHAHHSATVDQPGTDSWRHFHEGGVEAVLLLTGDRLSLVMRQPDGIGDPVGPIRRHFAEQDYHFVLVEGFKHGTLPKVEVHRRALHEKPIYDPADRVASGRYLAVVTDDPSFRAACRCILLDNDLRTGRHVSAVADLLEARLQPEAGDG